MTSHTSTRLSSGLVTLGLAVALAVGLGMPISAHAELQQRGDCRIYTLIGLYIFDAEGFTITPTGPQPKAIVEFMDFKGNGTVNALATVSLNGNPILRGIKASGTYTVNEDCTGTLSFSGPHFDIFISPDGREFHVVETDANTVLSGVVKRVSR